MLPKRKKLTSYATGKPDSANLEKEIDPRCFKGFVVQCHLVSGRIVKAHYYFRENVLAFSSMTACFKEDGFITLPDRTEIPFGQVEAIRVVLNLPDIIANVDAIDTLYRLYNTDFIALPKEELEYIQSLPPSIEK